MDNQVLYTHSSIVIILILFVAILAANEIGFRIGRYYQKITHREIKNQTIAIQAGTLGLLALLLGFTFNMSLERYDQRNMNQIDEANAINTAFLRSKLLISPYEQQSQLLLQSYLDARLEFAAIGSLDTRGQAVYAENIRKIQEKLWDIAVHVRNLDSRPITTGLYLQALNTMFDAEITRTAVFMLHVPEVIIWTLFSIFISTGALMGYSSGLSSKRAFIPTLIMTMLIVLVVLIIIDLDRPKRGIIKVSQDAIKALKK